MLTWLSIDSFAPIQRVYDQFERMEFGRKRGARKTGAGGGDVNKIERCRQFFEENPNKSLRDAEIELRVWSSCAWLIRLVPVHFLSPLWIFVLLFAITLSCTVLLLLPQFQFPIDFWVIFAENSISNYVLIIKVVSYFISGNHNWQLGPLLGRSYVMSG